MREQIIIHTIAIGLILLILVCCIPLVSAGTPISVSDQYSVRSAYIPVTAGPSFPPSLSPEQEAKKQEVMAEQDRINTLLKANRTFWEKKLESKLLQLLDSDSYKQTGKISEEDMNLMQTYYSVKSGTSITTGDLFLVQISLSETASEQIVDPYVAERTDTVTDPYHVTYCWVQLNKLQDIASLDEVKQVRLVSKPRTSGDIYPAPTTKPSLIENNSDPDERVPTPVLTTIDTPISKSGTASALVKKTNSSSYSTDAGIILASSASAPMTAVTITASLMIVLLCMGREKNRL